MAINKIEMQDETGNILYPHTSGDIVKYDDSTNVIQRINELQNKLSTLKASLTTAVNNKAGSSLTSDSTIQEITNEVNSIVTLSSGTSDATATTGQILSGSTAYVKGSKITGTMTNQGAVNQSLTINGSYTIPAGYHNGSGKITQSLATKAAATYMPGTSNQTINANTYLTGVQTIKGDTNLIPGNIISGKSIFGVNGTATVQSMGGSTIVKGQTTTTWASGTKLTCTIPSAGFVPSLAIVSTQSEGQVCNNLIVCSNGTTTYPSHLFGGVNADSFFNWSGNNSYGFSRDLVGGTSNDYSYGTSTFNADGSILISFSRYDAEVGNIIVRYMLIA